ncbi:MAG: NADH-quinone oxidoreductase subunit NuoH [Verrucomicrobiales bacterium]|jgi:NADH-quinone oxidoreductase subunit H|nr:NADH-quinone oxidoreductase subunit NuoH [Verrucomicrobiales bacterium]MDP6677340.1 NADH-quinone oxidoreductase subunit NuoH [Verrucomicrobiota bacterium]MDP6752541.1 NADH-quinone oxidoreductase subunit NuoH [Verrucomicrobiota bacterium]
MSLVLDILIATVPLLVIFPTLFAFTTWLERKALARIQNRVGPDKVGVPLTRYGGRFSLFGLGQPMADGIKMLFKENIVPRDADRLFHLLAPILALIPAMLVLCFLPLEFPWTDSLKPVQAFLLDGAVIFFFAITGLNTLAVFMAGWASRNKYSLLGGMRAIAQMVSYEIPLVLSAVVVVMMVGDLNAKEIADFQTGGKWIVGNWFLFTPWGLAAFVIFFIASLAETNRSPFDLPEAESELVAGYFTEYSGFKFALFFLGEYIAMFAISGLAVTLFLGGGAGPGLDAAPWLSVVWFIAKIFVLIGVMIWLRGTLPRLRVDQLMGFAWKFLLPLSILNILVAGFAWHATQQDSKTITVVTWVISLAVLYMTAKGLNQLNRAKVRPRNYRYAE